MYFQSLEGMCDEVIKLPNVFPCLSLIFQFPMACCCALTQSSTTPSLSQICVEQMFRPLLQTEQSIWEWDRSTHNWHPLEERSRRSQEAIVKYRFQHKTWPVWKKLLIKCRLPPGPPLTVFSRTHLLMKLYHCILGWLSLKVNLVPNICYWVKACLCTTRRRTGHQQQL